MTSWTLSIRCRTRPFLDADSNDAVQRTTLYYSNTTLYYKVLLRTAQYYSSTTLYYKVLLRTTQYCSNTTLYCTVLLQYYSVLVECFFNQKSCTFHSFMPCSCNSLLWQRLCELQNLANCLAFVNCTTQWTLQSFWLANLSELFSLCELQTSQNCWSLCELQNSMHTAKLPWNCSCLSLPVQQPPAAWLAPQNAHAFPMQCKTLCPERFAKASSKSKNEQPSVLAHHRPYWCQKLFG